jgi:hypothetical protein
VAEEDVAAVRCSAVVRCSEDQDSAGASAVRVVEHSVQTTGAARDATRAGVKRRALLGENGNWTEADDEKAAAEWRLDVVHGERGQTRLRGMLSGRGGKMHNGRGRGVRVEKKRSVFNRCRQTSESST